MARKFQVQFFLVFLYNSGAIFSDCLTTISWWPEGKCFQDNIVAKMFLCCAKLNKSYHQGTVSYNVFSIKLAVTCAIAELFAICQN